MIHVYVEFRWRYQLGRARVMNIIDIIRDDIQSGHDGRNRDLTLTLNTLLSLCFYATESSKNVS